MGALNFDEHGMVKKTEECAKNSGLVISDKLEKILKDDDISKFHKVTEIINYLMKHQENYVHCNIELTKENVKLHEKSNVYEELTDELELLELKYLKKNEIEDNLTEKIEKLQDENE